MKVLVTGGLGFIGSHLVDELIRKNIQTAVVDIGSRKDTINSRAQYYKADIRDAEALEAVLAEIRPEYVLHLAALARIQPSFADPLGYFKTNALGTANVLDLAKKYGVRRVVYSASSSAYSDHKIPFTEQMNVSAQALNPYSSTKRMGEMLSRDMGRLTGGVETVCLRYFNVYGPRQTTSADEAYPTVVGVFFEHLSRKKSLPIVPDGHQRRDFTYVSDVAEANIQAMLSDRVGSGEIVNIGFGKNYSVWEAARLIAGLPEGFSPEAMLTANHAVMAPARRGEARETLADITLAKKLLGWEPKVSFEDGIEKCRIYYRNLGWQV